jgi:hypothetical protein
MVLNPWVAEAREDAIASETEHIAAEVLDG